MQPSRVVGAQCSLNDPWILAYDSVSRAELVDVRTITCSDNADSSIRRTSEYLRLMHDLLSSLFITTYTRFIL